MNSLRSILALLYFLMMVALPYVHLTAHAHEGEHASDHGEDTKQSCAICQLLTQPVNVCKAEVSSSIQQRLTVVTEAIALEPDSLSNPPQQARAPPFMTA